MTNGHRVVIIYIIFNLVRYVYIGTQPPHKGIFVFVGILFILLFLNKYYLNLFSEGNLGTFRRAVPLQTSTTTELQLTTDGRIGVVQTPPVRTLLVALVTGTELSLVWRV